MVSGKAFRVSRIVDRGKMLCVPMDHSFTSGPIRGLEEPESMVKMVTEGGATAFLAHKGVLRALKEAPSIGMILHLSANTAFGPAPNRKVLVASVGEGVRLGADAVSVHINIGAKEEPEMLVQLGTVADECDNLQVPLIAMMYPRGEGIKNPDDPDTIAHVARIGAEAGADIVKTVYTGSVETFRDLVRKCPAPVVLAGGSKADSDRALLEMAYSVMKAGAMGVTFGRNVFGHGDPIGIVRALRRVVVEGHSVDSAMEALGRAD
ncbi:MAG: class I fructose-bisphosphate aldolase family protein [Nitrososphaerota archaeon]|nr:class I fructose-bisphosphate aldolase family protein [Nitrososphaerota archaeon]MDG6943198.1 class I fructose-bisphosphate aldolase family protein [Nitrososphaerota archaeon]MDG6950924.1 class I fructose-bisphosphate aldolase family protein [Nitrososphaerota archaeon]